MRRSAGFTLVELMVGLVIMAILISAAAPFMGDMIVNARLRESGNLLFTEALMAQNPNKLWAYNCSPSFNWKKNLNDKQIASFQEDLSALGYKYQFITLAGIHINWFNTFQFAHAYARGEGMKHYTEMVQEPEFAARDRGYTFVSHQQEVGAGYFDDVTTVIQGGKSSVTALTGSTEEEQFH